MINYRNYDALLRPWYANVKCHRGEMRTRDKQLFIALARLADNALHNVTFGYKCNIA